MSPPSYPAQPTSFCASTLVGRAKVLEGHESSKLPGSGHPFSTTTWSGGPGYRKGTSSLSYPTQPIFLCFQPSQAGSGIERARSSKLPGFAHLFCAINPDKLSGLAPFQKGRILNDYFAIAKALSDPPTNFDYTTSLKQDSHHQ
jgi:hypothetical protein